jgi:tetratricopeptide (TPR) repeat protein
MVRSPKKIRLIPYLAIFFVLFLPVPSEAARLNYLEQMPIEAFAKLREIERHQLKIAEKFYLKGEPKAAAAEYDKFLTLYERSSGGPYSLLMWAHCQVKLRLVNTAVRDGFKSVIDYWPDSHEAVVSWFMIGKCHLLNGEPSKADKVFAQLAEDFPKHSLATLSRVEMLGIATARKDQERRVELWTDIAYKTPKTKETASHRASAARSLSAHFFQENEFQKAVEAIDTYYDKNRPDHVHAVHDVGNSVVSLLFRSSETKARAEKLGDGLISFVEQALPDDSKDEKNKARTRDLLERITSVYKSLDRDKQVLATYERMGKILGMDDAILGSMAAWHKGKKRIDQARSIYGRYKDKVNGRRAIARSYREEKNFEEAVRQYLSLIGLDKDREAEWQRDVVGTWRDAYKWDKAIATYQILLKVDPDRYSEYNWGIAECWEKQSKWKEAILSYRQTDRFPEAYFRMAECHRHLKKWNEGLILLNQARSHDNVADRAQHRIAQFYELSGQKEKAIKSFQVTCKKYPKSRYASISHAHLQTKYGISVTLGGATDK